MAFHMLALNNL